MRGVSTPEQHYENLRVPQNELHDCQKLACQMSFSALTSSQTLVCFVWFEACQFVACSAGSRWGRHHRDEFWSPSLWLSLVIVLCVCCSPRGGEKWAVHIQPRLVGPGVHHLWNDRGQGECLCGHFMVQWLRWTVFTVVWKVVKMIYKNWSDNHCNL